MGVCSVKVLMSFICFILLSGCELQVNQSSKTIQDDLIDAKLTLPLVIDDQYVLTYADYEYTYDLSLFELVDDTVLTWLNEMNEYLRYIEKASDAMEYVITETNDTGIKDGEVKVVPENFVPIPKSTLVFLPRDNFSVTQTAHQSLDVLTNSSETNKPGVNALHQFVEYSTQEYSVFFPQLDLLFNNYTTVFTTHAAAYSRLYELLNHEDLDHQAILQQNYEQLKVDYTAILTCFFNEVYPTLAHQLVQIGYPTDQLLMPKREDIERNLFNYLQISNRYVDQSSTFYQAILDYCSLLSVIQEFHYLVPLSESTGVFELAFKKEESTLTEEDLSKRSLTIKTQFDTIKSSGLIIDDYFLEKLITANDMMLTYYTYYLPTSEVSNLEIKQCYWELYGLINSLIRDLEQDSLFNLSELLK